MGAPIAMSFGEMPKEWQKLCRKTKDGWMFMGPGTALHIPVLTRNSYNFNVTDFEVPLYAVFEVHPEPKIIREASLLERTIAENAYGGEG